MAPACNLSLPTERLESRRIPKPGLQHSWMTSSPDHLALRAKSRAAGQTPLRVTSDYTVKYYVRSESLETENGFTYSQTQELSSDWIKPAGKPYHWKETRHFWQPCCSVHRGTVHLIQNVNKDREVTIDFFLFMVLCYYTCNNVALHLVKGFKNQL